MSTCESYFVALQKEGIETKELDILLKGILSHYSTRKDELARDLTLIVTNASKWLKANPSSRQVTHVLRLLIFLYEIVGFGVEFKVEDYYRTSDKGDEKDPKNLDKAQLEGFEKEADKGFENPFFNQDLYQIVISYFNSIMTKNQTLQFKSHLVVLLPLISIYATDKKVQTLIRRQKLIKFFLKLFKDVIQNNEKVEQIDIELATYVCHIIAKISFQNRKNQEYIIRKNGHELFKAILATAPSPNLLKGSFCALANCCEKADYRLVLWCSGCFSLVEKKLPQVSQGFVAAIEKKPVTKQEKDNLNSLGLDCELNLLLLWKMSTDTDEVIEECWKSEELLNSLARLSQKMNALSSFDSFYPLLTRIIGLSMALLRRFAGSKKFRAQTVQRFFALATSVFLHYEKEAPGSNKDVCAFLFKELNAFFGLVSMEPNIPEELSRLGVLSALLRLSINLFDNPKMIKTSLGCLTNICLNEGSKEILGREKNLLILVYNVLEKYDYSGSIIEYCLKLIFNTLSNDDCMRNFSSPKILMKLLYLLFIYKADDVNSVAIVKILRILCSKNKTLELFMGSLQNFESANKDFDIVLIMLLTMKTNMESPHDLMEVILFLSQITQNSDSIKKRLENNSTFALLIRDILDLNKKDKDCLQMISNCMAYLPIEDMNSIF